MGTPTYTLISEQVLGSAQASVTFSSIPQTYKDLVLEILPVVSTGTQIAFRFNGDSGTNYSMTDVYGNGTAASSSRLSNEAQMRIAYGATARSTNVTYVNASIFSYANSNVYKTALARCGSAGEATEATVGLWRSSAAITSVAVVPVVGTQFDTGSIARLWGVVG